MLEQYATAENLSCLVNSYKHLETLPEPFRMQDSVTFRVTPSTYAEFILTLTPDSGVRLMTQLDVLHRLASIGSPKLYNSFLADVAFSILKEISYAELFHCYATIILPTSPTANNVRVSYLAECAYPLLNYEVENELRSIVINCGFELPLHVSDYNIDLYKTAVVLYSLSKCQTAVNEVNLLYDGVRKNL